MTLINVIVRVVYAGLHNIVYFTDSKYNVVVSCDDVITCHACHCMPCMLQV